MFCYYHIKREFYFFWNMWCFKMTCTRSDTLLSYFQQMIKLFFFLLFFLFSNQKLLTISFSCLLRISEWGVVQVLTYPSTEKKKIKHYSKQTDIIRGLRTCFFFCSPFLYKAYFLKEPQGCCHTFLN